MWWIEFYKRRKAGACLQVGTVFFRSCAIHSLCYIKTYVCGHKISSSGRIISAPHLKITSIYTKTVGRQWFAFCKLSARPQLSILKNFRSGIIMFFTLQTVFTNWGRRLAVIFHFQLSILKNQQQSTLTGTSKYKKLFCKKRNKNIYPALNFLCKTLYKSVFKW